MSFLEPDDYLSLIKRKLLVDDTLLAVLGSPGITVAYLSANAEKKSEHTASKHDEKHPGKRCLEFVLCPDMGMLEIFFYTVHSQSLGVFC